MQDLLRNYDEIAANPHVPAEIVKDGTAALRNLGRNLQIIGQNLNVPGRNLIQFRPKSHILRVSPPPQPRPKQPGVVCRTPPTVARQKRPMVALLLESPLVSRRDGCPAVRSSYWMPGTRGWRLRLERRPLGWLRLYRPPRRTAFLL